MTRISIILNRISPLRILKTIGLKLKESIINQKPLVMSKYEYKDSFDPNEINQYLSKELCLMIMHLFILILRISLIFGQEYKNSTTLGSVFDQFFAISSFFVICGLALHYYITFLSQCKQLYLIIFPLLISIIAGYFFALRNTYDFGILFGLINFLIIIESHWSNNCREINFYHLANRALFEGYSTVMSERHCLLYPEFKIFYFFTIHFGVLLSNLWLIWHIKLLRAFGENHLLSSVVLYTNIANYFLRMLCLLRFYGYPSNA